MRVLSTLGADSIATVIQTFPVQQTNRPIWELGPALSDKESTVLVVTAVVVSSRQKISLVEQLEENLRTAHFVVIVRCTFVHLPDLLLVDFTQVCFEAKIIGIYILVLGPDGPHLFVAVVPDKGPGAVVHDALVVIILSISNLKYIRL